MTIHCCDTNIILGSIFEYEMYHNECENFFFSGKCNPTFSQRSLREIDFKLTLGRKNINVLPSYVRDPKLIRSQLDPGIIRTFDSFLNVSDKKNLTSKTNEEVFQAYRDYELIVDNGIRVIRQKIMEKSPGMFIKHELIRLKPEIHGLFDYGELLEIIKNIISTPEEQNINDCKLLVDAIINFKYYSYKQGFKKLFFVSKDRHFCDNMEQLENDLADYFKSINEPRDILTICHVSQVA